MTKSNSAKIRFWVLILCKILGMQQWSISIVCPQSWSLPRTISKHHIVLTWSKGADSEHTKEEGILKNSICCEWKGKILNSPHSILNPSYLNFLHWIYYQWTLYISLPTRKYIPWVHWIVFFNCIPSQVVECQIPAHTNHSVVFEMDKCANSHRYDNMELHVTKCSRNVTCKGTREYQDLCGLGR